MTPSLTLAANQIAVGYDKRRVIDGLSLQVPQGRITALVGPNACGKSTLIRALARLQPLMDGAVVLDGADIHGMPTRSVARRLGILPQSPQAPEGITVADLVWRGRHPHHRLGGRRSRADDRVIAEALLQTGTADLFGRPVDSLSGGQRQRVWLAMALAQQTPALLLDEPTTFLDVAHQLELLDLLVDLNRDQGKTIVLVLHDLEQAAHYASTIIAMKDGRIVAQGDPVEILTEQLVWDVFGVRARILPDPDTGSPLVLARGRHDLATKPPAPQPEFSGKLRNE